MRALYESKCSYMFAAFGDLDFLVREFERSLRNFDYDTMIGRGLSGSLVVPFVSRALGKHWAIVRKEDGSHSSRRIEGAIGERWIFVDDFVDSGTTRRITREAVERECPRTTYVGTVEYEVFSKGVTDTEPPRNLPPARWEDPWPGPQVLTVFQ